MALLLIGYGIGRWQDTPSPAAAVVPLPSSAVPSTTPAASPSAAPTTAAPKPTVYQTMQAEDAKLNNIQTQGTTDDGGGKNIGWISNGSTMEYDNVVFGQVAATKLLVRVASDVSNGGTMEIHLDDPSQPAVGALDVTNTGGWQTWRTDEVTLTPITGTHNVFLVFKRANSDQFVNLNWIIFQH